MIRTNEPMEEREMLTEPIDDRLLATLVDRILATVSASAVVLFGSRAQGDARRWSDVDLLVVARTDRDPLAVAGELYMVLRPRTFGLDVVVMTPEELTARLHAQDPFVSEIVRCGRVLHGRLP